MCNLSTLKLSHVFAPLSNFDFAQVYVKSDPEQGITLMSRMAVKQEGPVQPVFYYVYIMLPDFAN